MVSGMFQTALNIGLLFCFTRRHKFKLKVSSKFQWMPGWHLRYSKSKDQSTQFLQFWIRSHILKKNLQIIARKCPPQELILKEDKAP